VSDEYEAISDQLAEQAVLACCLHSKVARLDARNLISGTDFFYPHHEAAWDLMSRLDRQDMEVDPVSLMGLAQVDRDSRSLIQVVMKITTLPVAATTEVMRTHAHTVRQYAVRRRLLNEATRLRQLALDPSTDALGMAATAVNRFQALRDAGQSSEDIEAMTVEEMILEVDDEPEWVIPGLFEKGDRFLLTGEEGLGKSHMLRQIVLMAAAGLDPFNPDVHIKPVKGMVIDFENSKRQIRRRLYTTYQYALGKGRGEPGLATILPMPRSDITQDKVLSKIHREIDACQPELLVIGPLYKMSPRALQTDDEATPVLAALDTIRDRGIALLIEAHAGKSDNGSRKRDMRPRGSSALLGWPEFGYGMVAAAEDTAALTPWRGDRDFRDIPDRVVRAEGGLWVRERGSSIHGYWQAQQDRSDLEHEEEPPPPDDDGPHLRSV